MIEHIPVSSVPRSTGACLVSFAPCSAGFRLSWMVSSPGGRGSSLTGQGSAALFDGSGSGSLAGIVMIGLVMLILILVLMPPVVSAGPASSCTLPSMELTTSVCVLSTWAALREICTSSVSSFTRTTKLEYKSKKKYIKIKNRLKKKQNCVYLF